MPTIDFSDDEHAAVTRAVRRAIDEDRFPHAPRQAPLRSALAKHAGVDAETARARPPLPKRSRVGHRRGKARR
jgi:hypothetical protein